MTDIDTEYEIVIGMLSDIFGKFRSHNDYKCQISFDCPVCSYEIKGLDHGDGKGNLEINYREGVFKCWACSETNDTHGSLHKLIRRYGTYKQLKQYELFMPEDTNQEFIKDHEPVKLPSEFVLFYSASDGMKNTHYYKQAKNYLKKRNITDDMIEKFGMGFCYQGRYANRIIIPSYDEELNLNYFIARSYETRPFRKYDNPEAPKDDIIFNEYLINWNVPIYLVEGVFDSIFLPNSIPMLGKTISEKLFSLLYEKAKEIIIVLDPDAWENSVNLFHKLNGGRLYDKVWVIKLEGNKDIADLQGNLSEYEKIKLE